MMQNYKKRVSEARKNHNRLLKMPNIKMPKLKMPNIKMPNINGYIEEANEFTRKIRDLLKNLANKAINEINSFTKAIANFFKNLFKRLARPQPPN